MGPTPVKYSRFAPVILADAYAQHDWLHKAVDRRLRGELANLHVDVNEGKSRYVDLAKGESFGFLGFEFRRVRSVQGKWQPYYSPKLKQRTVLLRKLKEVFRRFDSQPVGREGDFWRPQRLLRDEFARRIERKKSVGPRICVPLTGVALVTWRSQREAAAL